MPPMNSAPPLDPDPEPTQPQGALGAEPPEPRPRLLWRRLRLFALLIPLAVAAAGALGFASGAQAREQARREAVFQLATAQFTLALEDQQNGRLDLARQRLEYILRLDPLFPHAVERLTEVLVALGESRPAPTAFAPTPTPNLAPVSELFEQAEAAFYEGDWTRVIETLVLLRSKDPAYRAVEADGLLYVALRNRGLHLIRIEWELERGLYDLSRAQSFGPLDKEAEDWRTSARLYLHANTYFGLNWGRATDLFLDLCAPAALWDSCDRTRVAAEHYAEQIALSTDACAVVEAYDAWGWDEGYPLLEPVYEAVATQRDECERRSRPPATATPTPTPEGGAEEPPTDTPTP